MESNNTKGEKPMNDNWLADKLSATPSKEVERGEGEITILKLQQQFKKETGKDIARSYYEEWLENKLLEEYRQSSAPLPEGKGVGDVKELPEVLELDELLNTYAQYTSAYGNPQIIEIQKLFWAAVEAINKANLATPNPSPKGVEGLQWVKAEGNNLPEYGEYVLVNIGADTVLKGKRMRNGWVAFFADGETLVGELRPVTHWMPLPESPTPLPVNKEGEVNK